MRHLWRCSVFALILAAVVAGAETQVTPDLFEEALAFSKKFDPDTDTVECQKAFKKLIEQIRADLDSALKKSGAEKLEPAAAIEVLNKDILVDRNVTYISNKYWRDSLFTAALLKK